MAAPSYEGASHPVHVRPGFFAIHETTTGGGGGSGIESYTAEHLDEFDRTTAYGLGTGYTFYPSFDSAYAVASDSEFFVDGSKLFVPDSLTAFDSYDIDGAIPPSGEITIEMFLPVLPSGDYVSGAGWWPALTLWVDTGRDDGFGDHYSHRFHIEQDYGEAFPLGPAIRVGSGFTEAGAIEVEPGNVYIFKMRYGSADQDCLYRAWKKGTDEPSTWIPPTTSVRHDVLMDPGHANVFEIIYASAGVTSYFDNLAWDPVAVVYDSGVIVGDPVPIGPSYDEPRYKGQSSSIFATAKSPAGMDSTKVAEATPLQTYPVYRGVSRAIHVFGADDATVTPVPPAPCVPDGYVNPCVAIETFGRTSTDDWGVSELLDIPWQTWQPPPQVETYVASDLAHDDGNNYNWLIFDSGALTPPIEVLVRMKVDTILGAGDTSFWFEYSPDVHISASGHLNDEYVGFHINTFSSFAYPDVTVDADGSFSYDDYPDDLTGFNDGGYFLVRMQVDSAGARIRMWHDEGPGSEPVVWQAEVVHGLTIFCGRVNMFTVGGGSFDGANFYDSVEFVTGLCPASDVPACDNVSTDLTTCWNESVTDQLDDFARALVVAGGEDATIGCTSRGHYTWLDQGSSSTELSLLLSLDGGLRAQLRGPEYDPVSGSGVTSGGYQYYVYLPLEARHVRVSFNAQLEMGDFAPLGGGRTSRAGLGMFVERHEGSSFVPGNVSRVQDDYNFEIYIQHLFGEDAKIWLNRAWDAVDVQIGSAASAILGVVLEVTDTSVHLTVGAYSETVTIPVNPSTGDGFAKLSLFSAFRNIANDDLDPGYVANANFLSRVSNLRVHSDLGNCVDVPPNSFSFPTFNGACTSDVRLLPPHSSTIYDGVTFRRQIGDPTTTLDRTICMLESAAMVLDWQTRGGLKLWGGELVPWCGRAADTIRAIGTNLENCQLAWRHFGQYFDIRKGQSWAQLVSALGEGRAVVLAGHYGSLASGDRCSSTFTEAHGIALFPYFIGTKVLVGDPLCPDFKYVEMAHVQAFAESLGVEFYGSHTPQPVYFGVSRAWA